MPYAPPPAGRYSVAFPRRWWYPACRSGDLRRGPVGITVMDTPLVVFRQGDGRAAALLDRCPHRNVPLSMGRVHPDGPLECAYHGWRFDGAGRCGSIPGLDEALAPSPTREVPSWPVREEDGFVWVWGEPASEPDRQPFALPRMTGGGAGEAIFTCDLDCTMHAAIENALDVPHTAFLHRGIFRGNDTRELTAVRRDLPDGVEVQYLGEPVGFGPVKARPDSSTTFDHWDRFFLPCVAQVEYRVEGWMRITNSILHLPLTPFRTRAWFVVRFWSRLPAAVVRPVVLVQGKRILAQDAGMLARQTENIRRFGGERYSSSDLDVIGQAIWRLLRQAERAERPDDDGAGDPEPAAEGAAREVTFRV